MLTPPEGQPVALDPSTVTRPGGKCHRCGSDSPAPATRGNPTGDGYCIPCQSLTCPTCGRPYRRTAGHCMECCTSFASTGGFDAHRRGGRCLTAVQLAEAGWTTDPSGYLHVPGGFAAAADLRGATSVASSATDLHESEEGHNHDDDH